MKNSKTLKIAQTAIFLALLIVFQYVSKPLGQLVTGSLVNFTLIGSVLAVGLAGGAAVALISPFLAFSLGIGPAFVQLIPMIALGNLVLVLVYHFMLKNYKTSIQGKNLVMWVATVFLAAGAKFAALYFGVVKVVLPSMSQLKPPQVTALSGTFSLPQFITATIGGALAFLVMPAVLNALHKNKN